MSEAPEKIWLDKRMRVWEENLLGYTPYIRADLVDELVEALEQMARPWQAGTQGYFDAVRRAKAALAKVRGEKNG